MCAGESSKPRHGFLIEMPTGDGLYNTDCFKMQMKKLQTRKRYIHSVNVAEAAAELAALYGADAESAYVAGLLHDICKDMPCACQRGYALDCRFPMSREEARSKPLWHAPAGAHYAQGVLGIGDGEILAAIRYHTVGRAEMSRLEEIVYTADLISADRKYKDASRIRKLAYLDLDAAMLEILRFSIESVIKKGVALPPVTVQAYNHYLYKCDRVREVKESESNG